MARIASTTSNGISIPGGGLTLDALMERAKAQAAAQQAAMAPRTIQSPWQGAAQMAESFLAGHRERAAEKQLAEGRSALAQIMSGIDPTAGPSPEQLAQSYQLDPDLGLKLMAQAQQARRDAAALSLHNTERSQDREWQLSDAQRQAEQANANREDQQTFQADQQARQQTFAEKQAEAARQVPKSTEGQIMADYKNGVYGDPATPEAMQLRDDAMKKATAIPTPAGVNADRKALWGQQDEYINTASSIGKLQHASDLLKAGINTGYTAGARTMWGNAGMPGGDKAMADRTKEYNAIMTAEAITAMSQALKGATTDTEMARFIEIMNDPTIDVSIKQRQLDTMLAKARSFNELQGSRIKQLGGEIPAAPAAVSAEEEATILQQARDAIAAKADPALVKKRLVEKGIDPGKL